MNCVARWLDWTGLLLVWGCGLWLLIATGMKVLATTELGIFTTVIELVIVVIYWNEWSGIVELVYSIRSTINGKATGRL